MQKTLFVTGSVFGFLSVLLGAFGAHALRARLEPRMLEVFETGARYQMYHAVALLLVAWAASRWPGAVTTASGWLMVAGTVFFSGSLYAMALTDIRVLGAITPIGGVCFIAGWLCLAIAAMRA